MPKKLKWQEEIDIRVPEMTNSELFYKTLELEGDMMSEYGTSKEEEYEYHLVRELLLNRLRELNFFDI